MRADALTSSRARHSTTFSQEIKDELFKRGISFTGLFEKSELVEKLLVARAETPVPQEAQEDGSTSSRLTARLCALGGARIMQRLGRMLHNVLLYPTPIEVPPHVYIHIT